MKVISWFRLGIKAFGSFVVSFILGTILILVFLSDNQPVFLAWLSQILSILVVFGQCYSCIWNEGRMDFNRVKSGQMTYNQLKGLKAGCVVIALPVLFWAVTMILKISGVSSIFGFPAASLYKILNFPLLFVFNAFFGSSSLQLLEISYRGLALCLVPYLILLFFCTAAYISGYHQFSLMEILIFKHLPKRKPKQKR